MTPPNTSLPIQVRVDRPRKRTLLLVAARRLRQTPTSWLVRSTRTSHSPTHCITSSSVIILSKARDPHLQGLPLEKAPLSYTLIVLSLGISPYMIRVPQIVLRMEVPRDLFLSLLPMYFATNSPHSEVLKASSSQALVSNYNTRSFFINAHPIMSDSDLRS